MPFADIAKALNDEPHIVQVGIGELSKNFYQIENLKIKWLFSPTSWPVYVSGFNPAIHEPQVFQYDLKNKKLQVTNGIARESLTHEDMARMVSSASNPAVDIVSLPCEEDEAEAVPSLPENSHEGKAKKLKRKANRKHQSFIDAIEAMKGLNKQKIVCPIVHDMSGIDELNVLGYSGRTVMETLTGLKFVQIHNPGSNEDILNSIKALIKSVDIVETDFPFKLAKEGVLLNSDVDLINLKQAEFFNDHSDLLSFSDTALTVPESVRDAGAHMKSYIHHLFRCDELSGPILLATVNLYQFEKMFRSLA